MLIDQHLIDNARLWSDKLGQISLATTTLFWGVSGNLRYSYLADYVASNNPMSNNYLQVKTAGEFDALRKAHDSQLK